MKSFRSFLFAALAIAAGNGIAACTNNIAAPPPFIHGPSDSVVAGPLSTPDKYPAYMFVSGQERNLVYVVDLELLQFKPAPNLFYPLEIPVCRSPAAVAATSDNLYVLVLCASDHRIEIIDATTLLRVRDGDNTATPPSGEPISASAGGGGTRLLFTNVDANGASHFVSVNSGDSTLTLLHVDETKDPKHPVNIVVDTTYTLGVNVLRGTVDDTGTFLYTADPTTTLVHKVDLTNGAVTDFDLQAAAVDLVYDAHTRQILAATPETSGLTLLNVSNGTIVDTKPVYAPLASDSTPYLGVYLGEIPRRISIVDVNADTGTGFNLTCAAPNGNANANTNTQRYALVAVDTGPSYFVDLGTDQVMTVTGGKDCELPTVVPTLNPDPYDLFGQFKPFEPCTTTLPPRQQCVTPSSGVIVYPGHTGSTGSVPTYRVQMVWNAVLPGGDRSTGGGILKNSRTVADIAVDLSKLPVPAQAGDTLAIVSSPATSAACLAAHGDENVTSQREFVIASVNSDGSVTLTTDVDTSCFSQNPGDLAYQIIMGNAFLLLSAPTANALVPQGRVSPGDTWGANNFDLVRFKLRADIASDPVVVAAGPGMLIDFTVTETFHPLLAGLLTDTVTGTFAPPGRGPTAITVTQSGSSAPLTNTVASVATPDQTTGTTKNLRAFVSYGGNDVISVFQADNSATLSDTFTLQ